MPSLSKANALDRYLSREEIKTQQDERFRNLMRQAERERIKEQQEAAARFDEQLRKLTRETQRATQEIELQFRKPLRAEVVDLLREQLRPCFKPPFEARGNPDLVADIKVAMNHDGTIREAQIAETTHYSSDAYRALADSGLKALKNPRCSPLRLPQEQHEQWKTFTFGVSIRNMQ